MTEPTPNITGAIAAIEDAIAAVRDARTCEEAPDPILALVAMRLRDDADVLTFHERT